VYLIASFDLQKNGVFRHELRYVNAKTKNFTGSSHNQGIQFWTDGSQQPVPDLQPLFWEGIRYTMGWLNDTSIKTRLMIAFGVQSCIALAGSITGLLANQKTFAALETAYRQNAVITQVKEEQLKALYQSTQNGQWLFLAGTILFGVTAAVGIAGPIASKLQQLCQAAHGLAEGDLHQPLTFQGEDELGQMATSLRALKDYQQEMADVAQAISEGNLSRNIQPKSSKDVLGQSFARMTTNLRDVIQSVAESAEGVTVTGTRLSAASTQSGNAVAEISNSIQEVARSARQSAMTSEEMAKGSEQQARSASEAAEAMRRLSEAVHHVQSGSQQQQNAAHRADMGMTQATQAVQNVYQSAQQMAVAANEAASIAQDGGQSVQQTIASMGRIREQVEASALKVKELGQKGQEIGAIVETIDQIAEQTNLLALNAAIEAARAGEHGKGFAVVADEVRKLAERSAQATREIGSLIGSVRSDVEAAVKAMDASHTEVSEGAARSEEAGSALRRILQSVQSLAEDVQKVTQTAQQMSSSIQSVRESVGEVLASADENSRAVERMAAGAEQVSTAISTVASISQETAAGAEEMSASAQEVSTSAQTVTHAVAQQKESAEQVRAVAEDLNQVAERLQTLARKFQINADSHRTQSRPNLRMVA
jgi:methyl-accepting chemotaxis protein